MPADADPRYPVGPFDLQAPITPAMRPPAVDVIAAFPKRLRGLVEPLSEPQLDTPYRAAGWTVRQVVHHVADSHMNAYVRLKLALTEDNPTIKPYDQNAWAALPDSRLPVDVSLPLIEAVHARWTLLWRSLSPEQFGRTFVHPELGPLTLDVLLQLYAWHSRHHAAHIESLVARRGW